MNKVTATDAKTGETVEVGVVPAPRLVLFHNHERDKVYGGLFRADKNAFVPGFELAEKGSQTSINWLCAQAGHPALKIADLPAGTFKFEPGDPKVAVCDSRGRWVVNEWVEPAIRSKAIACAECPTTIRAVLQHVLGNDPVSFDRFVNWLAVAYQTNKPCGTAWILSGCQLTGKGLLYHQICAPLFGEEYCQQKNATELTDQFNAWLEKCVLLNVDEADFGGGVKNGLDAKMRMWITGPRLSVRGMHEVLREVPNNLNVILTSNLTVVADLPRGDRRFSVSPPQRVQLTAKFPDTDLLVKQIEHELPRFAGYLAQYPVNAALARTAMQSQAKIEMIEAAATGPTQFAEALRDGNLQYFVDAYLDLSGRVSRLGEAEDFRATVTGWVQDSIRALDSPVRTSTLCDIYNLIFRRRDEMTSDGLGKFLGKHSLSPKRMNTKRMCGRGFLVRWKAPADAVPTVEALIAKATGPQRDAERELTTIEDIGWLETTTEPERILNS